MKIRQFLPPLLACLTATATAAERTWDGGDATTNMTVALNWNGNTVINPAVDDLNFPDGLALVERTVNNNYPANTLFKRLEFYDGGYTLNGTIMGITNGLGCFHNTGTVTVNASFTLQGDQGITADQGGALVFGAGSQIYLNGHDLEFHPLHGQSDIYVDGLLAGTSPNGILIVGEPVAANDTSNVWFRGPKTFSAPITIGSGGELVITDEGGLGQGAGGTRLIRGRLRLSSFVPMVIPEAFTFVEDNNAGQVNTIISDSGSHRLTGPISIADSAILSSAGGTLSVEGRIQGTGSFDTFGTLILGGSQPNSFFGLSVNSGLVLLQKTAGVDATAPNLFVGDLAGEGDTIEVRHMAAHQIPDFSSVTVRPEGLLNLNGHAETIGSLAMKIPARITTGGATLRVDDDIVVSGDGPLGSDKATLTGNLRLGQANTDVWVEDSGADGLEELLVTGSVSTAAPGATLTKKGDGDLRLVGNHTLTQLIITKGSCDTLGHSPGMAVVVEGALFAGEGTIGTLTVAPGTFDDPSLVTAGGGGIFDYATLACGDFTLSDSTYFRVGLTGIDPEDHDQFNVTGTVNLSGAYLVLDVPEPAALAQGQEVVLISNDGVDPVVGAFNLAEGTLVSGRYVLSYKGGDGNDVTLTYIDPPTGVTRIWDGGGADNNWMTPNNWNPNGQPEPGDALVFPTVAARKSNVNNFPGGTTFQSLTVHGTGYTLGGNNMILNEKVEFTSENGDHFLSLPITLALDASISLTGNSLIQATAAIHLNGNKLTLHHAGGGDGDLLMTGNISGNGHVSKTGPGKVTWDNVAHTYLGATSVQAGTLVLSAGATLGDSAGSTTIDAGATIDLRSTIDGAAGLGFEYIFLHGRILVNAGAFSLGHAGIIQAAAATATIEVNDNTFNAHIITGGVLHKTGTGLMYIHLDNTLNGGLFVDAGELRSEMLGGGCDCTISIGATGLPAKFSYGVFGDQVSDTGAVLLMNPAAVFDIGAQTDTISALIMNGGSITGTGLIALEVLNVQANAATAVIAAPIANSANKAGTNGILQVADGAASPDLRIDSIVYGTGFDKTGAGRVDLMAEIPLAGLDLLNLQEGSALFFNNSRYTTIHLNGGLLGGNGTVGNLSSISGGVIAPGSSPGALGGNIGTWNAATTLRMELNGLSPGAEHDQYFVNAELILGDTTLDLSVGIGFDPAPGAEFMIVRNVGGFPISGTFAGVPENGYVSAAGAKVFQVTYTGGDGDDVVLTRVAVDLPHIINHVNFPGTDENKGNHGTGLTVQGTPGLTYQLETSTDLQTWTKRQFMKADLQTGLMLFEFFNPETDPKLFLRVGLP